MKILIVDDSSTQRLILKSIVSSFNPEFEIFELTDAQSALDTLERESIDLIFSDINMEPFTGIELIKKAKEKKIETEFIFVTSHLTEGIQDQVKALGVNHYIKKPITQDQIEKVLVEVLNA